MRRKRKITFFPLIYRMPMIPRTHRYGRGSSSKSYDEKSTKRKGSDDTDYVSGVGGIYREKQPTKLKKNPMSLKSWYAIRKKGSTTQWYGNQSRSQHAIDYGWGPAAHRIRFVNKAVAKKEARRVGGEARQIFSGWPSSKANPRRYKRRRR